MTHKLVSEPPAEKTVQSGLENLALALQALPDDSPVTRWQQLYQQLREHFAYLLFSIKKVPDDHYAWLLMNHDASRSLDRLIVAYGLWQNAKTNGRLRRAYHRELADFKWLLTTAISCKP